MMMTDNDGMPCAYEVQSYGWRGEAWMRNSWHYYYSHQDLIPLYSNFLVCNVLGFILPQSARAMD